MMTAASETNVVVAPDVRYTKSGSFNIAYQVLGNGPIDLLYVAGWISHLDLYWEQPTVARFLRRLGEGFRLILFDRRGTGLSDRVSDADLPTLEGRMDDLRAVLDAAGSSNAAVFAQGYGTPIGIMFAATYPDRTRSLILYSPVAKAGLKTDDYPWGSEPGDDEEWWAETGERWGTEEFARAWLRRLAPSADGDPSQVAWHARMQRAASTPSAAVRFNQMNALMDVRDLLRVVHVPTLVLEREDSVLPKGGVDFSGLAESRWIAERIPDARLVTLPGRDYLPWVGDYESLVREIASFASGNSVASEPDRVLLTVLFTDVVGATDLLARVGDRHYGDLLVRHDALVRRSIERFNGIEVDHAGDGVFATFDGPARAIRCAQEIVKQVDELGIQVRAGVHTGECELDAGRVRGIAVHTGSRIAAVAGAGEVLVSKTVTDLVAGSGLEFVEHSTRELKGVPGTWELYAAV
jgi:pimeloyl-ACP methyl ester carboxylesterase